MIDQRYRNNSFGESVLMDIIELCYVYDPKRRVGLDVIVQKLKEAVAEDERRQQTGELSSKHNITMPDVPPGEKGKFGIYREDPDSPDEPVHHDSDEDSDESKSHSKDDELDDAIASL